MGNRQDPVCPTCGKPLGHERHPDIFTPAEAAEYLHLDPHNGERTLKTLRDSHGLIGQQLGPTYMYHRSQLDAVVVRIFGLQPGIVGMPKRRARA